MALVDVIPYGKNRMPEDIALFAEMGAFYDFEQ